MTKKEYTEAEVRLIIDGAIAEEREACAKLCDKETNQNDDKFEPVTQYQSGSFITAEYLAAAIRSRGLHNMNKQAEKNGEEL
jgi:hypothetical protein